jgi:hypothetical protein
MSTNSQQLAHGRRSGGIGHTHWIGSLMVKPFEILRTIARNPEKGRSCGRQGATETDLSTSARGSQRAQQMRHLFDSAG